MFRRFDPSLTGNELNIMRGSFGRMTSEEIVLATRGMDFDITLRL